MEIPKNYFHDRLILFLLSINSFFVMLGIVMVLLGLGNGTEGTFIIQYRANLGVINQLSGSSLTFITFIVFLLVMLVVNTMLSMRIYTAWRQLSVVILSLSTLLILLTLVVINLLLSR